jgi:peptidoglycan/LPS O-acetylase OafA/YrhL
VGNATFSVDTFFFISGLLVVMLFLKAEKSKSRKNLSSDEDNLRDSKHSTANEFWLGGLHKTLMLIFYRFLRLTPAYLFIMVLTELSMK